MWKYFFNIINELMKYVLTFLIVILQITTSFAQPYKYKYQGIGYEALNFERQNGIKVDDKAFILLDSIVAYCKKNIKVRNNYSNEEASELLREIGSSIEKFKITYDTLNLFSLSLTERKMDCKFYTLTYLTIAKNLNLPLNSMIAPKHSFIYWKDQDNEIYWETTRNDQRSRQIYIDSLKISQKTIDNEVYLQAFNFNKSRSIVFAYIANYFTLIGNTELATSNYKKAIEYNPYLLFAFNNLANSQLSQGDYLEAIENYNKVLELDPDYYIAFKSRAYSKYKNKSYKDAIVDYLNYLKFDSNNIETLVLLADSYLELGQYENSKKYYLLALKFDLHNISIRNSIALLYFREKKYKESLEQIEIVLAKDQNNYQSYFLKANIFYLTNEYEKSISNFSKAIEIDKNKSESYYNRGLVYFVVNRKKDACNDLKQALKLGMIQAKDKIEKYCQ